MLARARDWRAAAYGALLLILGFAPALQAQVSLTTLGTPVTQNFDTLPASGSATWTNNSTIPGWFHARTGTGTTIVANNGSSNAGNLYSYGTGTATDRALGSVGSGNAAVGNLFWGVRLQNNTGATITSLDVTYTGEEWRNSAAAAQTISFSYLVGSPTVTGSLAEFQSAGVAVPSLDFTSPITGGTAGALDGNLAANRVTLTFSIGGLSIPNGTEVMLRWSDPDHTGADHGLSIDDFSVTPQGGPPTPTLNINDVTLAEGNPPGTTTFTFAVTLTSAAGGAGVTFDIATADGTAQDGNPLGEDNDYVAQSLTGQSIGSGSTGPYNFSVTVNRDTTAEPNETFFVNVTNIVGANAGDAQGLGTINNDDVTLTPIHDIQGPGNSSPLSGSVTTTGIVTGRKSNGFFLQEPDASVDADPATSEGIFVFTGAAPPASAAVGNAVQVTGTIAEFVPTQDPLQPPLTELTSPTVVQLSTGNPLPAAIPLSATFPDPAGPFDQLERVEGMRVSVASLTVAGATGGNVNEANATATSNGVLHGRVTGVARPFREPGIENPDPPPSGGGTIPPIPRWDANPELISVDSDAVGGTQLNVNVGAVITGLIGPLDYGFRRYTLLPDAPPALPPAVAGGVAPTAVTVPTAQEFTVASYNLERFFDTVNDPGIGEPVLTAVAFDNRLNKASNGIRNFLRTPDILGVVEVENLSTLQALAARISSDAIAAAQPDPLYQAFLVEGNDVGGIDVGFLVKQQIVAGATPRVTVNAVVQENAGELFVNPDASTELLNDRPSLRLDAVVNNNAGATFPITVIVNHLRSLIGVNDEGAGSSGWPTAGARVRAKRQAQANSLANLVQTRQAGNPAERIVLVGDFNAFEFNDGFGHSMGTIVGQPPPDNQTAVPGDGIDLVNPDFTILLDAVSPHSFVFGGNAQSLDHAAINAPLIAATTARRIEHPRINADFGSLERNNAATPTRLADHDPLVTYYTVGGFATADLQVTKTDTPDPVTAGTNLTYTITVTNAGPDPAATVALSDAVPANTTFVSLPTPAGWSCSTPPVGGTGSISCTNPSVAVGATVFTLTVNVNAATANGATLTNTATVTSTTGDPNAANNSDTETTSVGTSADLAVTKTDTPDPVNAGSNITYTLTLVNNGPSDAQTVSLSDTVPANTTLVSWQQTAGPAFTLTSGATVTATAASFAAGASATFSLVVTVNAATADGTVISNTATATTATADPDPADNSATATTTVVAQADLSVTKTDTPDPVNAGSNITYTVTLANAGPVDAQTVSLSDTVPANTTLVSWQQTAGPAFTLTSGTTVTATAASFAAGASATFSLVVTVNAGTAGGTVISNTASATTATTDPNAANNSATATTTVQAPVALTATKAASGPRTPGSTLTYTIVISNGSANAQPDNPGDEFVDVLPTGLTLLSASASSGIPLATIATNTVTWNGTIAAGGSVTITIQARIDAGPGATIVNQGTVNFDADGNGTNESSVLTDDPSTGTAGDPTGVIVLQLLAVPTLSPAALLALLAALGLLGALTLRRRAPG